MKSTAILTLLFLLASQPLHSQGGDDSDPLRSFATRGELESLLNLLDQTIQAPVYGEELKDLARADAEVLRARLGRGDLETGDRVLLVIETPPARAETLLVNSQRAVVITGIGTVGVDGVLRAELEAHLLEFLTRYLRDPNIRASSLIRLSIFGSVGAPGFYTVPSDRLVSDILMMAGAGGSENLDDTRIERNSVTFVPAHEIRRAIIEGRTLAQLGVRAGDRFVIPGRRNDRPGGFGESIRGYLYLLSIPGALIGLLTRLF